MATILAHESLQVYFNDKAAMSVLETLVFQQVKSPEASASP